MRRSYVVAMRWMVIYEYEVPGRAINLNSTKLLRPWSPRGSSPSRKNPHGRTGNRTRDLMISSQKLWPLDHEAGLCQISCHGYFQLRSCLPTLKNPLKNSGLSLCSTGLLSRSPLGDRPSRTIRPYAVMNSPASAGRKKCGLIYVHLKLRSMLIFYTELNQEKSCC
jgi:hypothetical protein